MKKKLLGLTLSLIVSSQFAMAQTGIVRFHYDCPKVSGTNDHVLYFEGDNVKGLGTETIQSISTVNYPLFQNNIKGANIPIPLKPAGYANSDTTYDVAMGIVSCFYEAPGFDTFHVDYTIPTGKGGYIKSNSASSITIEKDYT